MSVYTKVERKDLEAFLGRYDVGGLISFQGISAGIENTNYFVTTSGGEWVLTLFETLEYHELPYCLNLMDHLAAEGLPSPAPVSDLRGHFLGQLLERPAALVARLPGRSVEAPDESHCAAMGRVLGKLHVAGLSYPGFRTNSRGPHWWTRTAARVLPVLSTADATLLREELRYQHQARRLRLPRGVIHGDLFRDNVLFRDGRLSGLIDFYYACNDALLYDLAVAANDWCTTADGDMEPARLRAALEAYAHSRPFQPDEAKAWNTMLRAAALRFWLSRLHDLHFPRPGEITHTKDPQVFATILRRRVAEPAPFLAPVRSLSAQR
ncbi:MAG TPA: homoserine kinase [Gammaproteobacteria bacterium]|nr:homoserine kinase [Gammaproteobacteria bacterium]